MAEEGQAEQQGHTSEGEHGGQAEESERQADAEGSAGAGPEEVDVGDRQSQPFDDNPPVDPSEPQVGNSQAVFFMPREEEGSDEGDEGEDGEDGEEEDE